MSTYTDLYLADGAEPSTFSSDIHIYSEIDKLNSFISGNPTGVVSKEISGNPTGNVGTISENNLYACLSEPVCVCESIEECDCDHDEFTRISKIEGEMGSNCSFFIRIYCDHALNREKNKTLKEETETLTIKLFHFDKNDKETVDLIVDRHSRQITIGEYLFDIDDKIKTTDSVIYINLNYMNYKHVSDKSESKFSM
jgi:hypothetical protein